MPDGRSGFRADINGLRGLAVALVVLYHFGWQGIGGGYVGVDVFYVISGFLMTQIVLARPGILAFYAARARRILPALAALVAALIALGFFLMPPKDYQLLGKHSLSALGFVSNVVFSNGGDYFDSTAKEKWLLHTWSLSVEWQFYLLLPFVLALLRKINALRAGMILLAFASLVTSIIWTARNPGVAFFMLPTRAWEMLAGGLIFLYPRKTPGALSLAGLAAVLAAAFFYSDRLDYPGALALLPVLGACAVIAAAARNPLLDNDAAQFLGKISYSLYLWHWPAAVLAHYTATPPAPWMLAPVLALSYASWRWIEEPFRKHRGKAALKTAAYLLVAAIAGGLWFFKGLPARVSPEVLAAAAQPEPPFAMRGTCQVKYKRKAALPDCLIGAETPPAAALWGDSHADALAPALGAALARQNLSARVYGYSGCPPVLDALQDKKNRKFACRDINRFTYDRIAADAGLRDVFFIARWPLYEIGFNETDELAPLVNFEEGGYGDHIVKTMCGLARAGKRVHALAPVPEMGRPVPDTLARALMLRGKGEEIDLPRATYESRTAPYRAILERAHAECGVQIIDPAPALCDEKLCHGLKNGETLYADDDHLNARGGALLTPLFAASLRR